MHVKLAIYISNSIELYNKKTLLLSIANANQDGCSFIYVSDLLTSLFKEKKKRKRMKNVGNNLPQ